MRSASSAQNACILNRQTGFEEVVLHTKPSDNQCKAHFSTSRHAAQVRRSSRPSKKDGFQQGGGRQAMPLVHFHSSPAVIGAGLPERRFWSVTDKPQGRRSLALAICDGSPIWRRFSGDMYETSPKNTVQPYSPRYGIVYRGKTKIPQTPDSLVGVKYFL